MLSQKNNSNTLEINVLKKTSIHIINKPELTNTEFVYIKHVSNKHIFKLPYTTVIHSKYINSNIIENITSNTYGKIRTNPMIINDADTNIDFQSMEFVINYMKYYDNDKEHIAPEAPIKNIHISLVIGEEYVLFDNIYDEQDSLKEKLSKINNILIASLYFKIKHLHKKLCAISASLLLNSNIDEIKRII